MRRLTFILALIVSATACGGGSGIDLEAVPAQMGVWQANTGISANNFELWEQRMIDVCEQETWDTDVATDIGARFVAEDTGLAPNLAGARRAGRTLTAMALEVCPDAFVDG